MPLKSQKTASPLLVIIAFATVYLVWGSTYFFIRIAEQGGMPPLFARRYTVYHSGAYINGLVCC